jgi:hypothetical protein
LEATLRIVDPDMGMVSTLLPPKLFARDKEAFEYPEGVTATNTAAPKLFDEYKSFGYMWSHYMELLLQEGSLKGHPFEVVPGGLHGVLDGLRNLRDGKASGIKYVYRIDETGGFGIVKVEVGSDMVGEVSESIADFPFSVNTTR